ncbi:hypothetical protein QM437_14980 [Legionella pneumophila]|uniref:hypothetical protein n=1 Tax=Legionella pneumophila TaxID=446 RepID=UPI0024B8147C|nr:hypothetical protein [Legionella pneumophila]MDI9826335.1 hypothetical protein [Legionella pneumophila]
MSSVTLQPSEEELLAARERMQNFKTTMRHNALDLTANQEEMKKDDSSTPLTITPKPPWEQ